MISILYLIFSVSYDNGKKSTAGNLSNLRQILSISLILPRFISSIYHFRLIFGFLLWYYTCRNPHLWLTKSHRFVYKFNLSVSEAPYHLIWSGSVLPNRILLLIRYCVFWMIHILSPLIWNFNFGGAIWPKRVLSEGSPLFSAPMFRVTAVFWARISTQQYAPWQPIENWCLRLFKNIEVGSWSRQDTICWPSF